MTDADALDFETLTLDRRSARATRIRQLTNSLIRFFGEKKVSHDDSVSAMCNLLVGALELAPMPLAKRLDMVDQYARAMKAACVANDDKRRAMM